MPESKGGGLSSGALKRLQWCKEQVKEENDRLDKARSEHPNRGGGGVRAMVPLDVSHALAQQPQQNDASLLLSCIIPPSADLLPTWEHMRQDLFGPRGLTVAGLYAKGVKGARSICPMQQPQVGREGSTDAPAKGGRKEGRHPFFYKALVRVQS